MGTTRQDQLHVVIFLLFTLKFHVENLQVLNEHIDVFFKDENGEFILVDMYHCVNLS